MTDYEKQPQDFLTKTNTAFKAEFKEHGLYFDDDKESRDIYNITLTRGEREYKFTFGQSLANSGFKIFLNNSDKESLYKFRYELMTEANGDIKKYERLVKQKLKMYSGMKIKNNMQNPTPYDVLACLTKYDPESFKDFCDCYGYDTDSRKAEKIYKAVCDEWLNVQKLWNDEEIELLREVE